MPFAQGLPVDLQRLPKERLRLLMPARSRQKGGKVAEPSGVFRMPIAQDLPTDLQRLPVERFRLLMPARSHQKVGEVVQPNGVTRMPFAQGLSTDLHRLPKEGAPPPHTGPVSIRSVARLLSRVAYSGCLSPRVSRPISSACR